MDVQAEYMDTPHRRVLDLRLCGLGEVPMLGWYHYVRAQPDLPVHRHEGGFEICYLERGRQVFEVGGRQYSLSGGDIFLTCPDEPHSTGGNPSEPGVLYWINLRLPKGGCGVLGLERREAESLLEGIQRSPCRHFRATPQTRSIFRELFALYDRPDTFQRAVRMRCGVVRLLFEVIDGSLEHAASATSQRMTEVIEWIRAHPQGDYSLKDLARRAHLSVSHFKKRFKIETGLSPWQYILHHRIEIARDQLSKSDASVTQVAHDLGFSSSQYFATVFKRMTGLTPTACRERLVPGEASRRGYDGQQGE